MTGPGQINAAEHRAEAERLLERAAEEADAPAAYLVSVAQVHALLALSAPADLTPRWHGEPPSRPSPTTSA